MTAEWIHEKNRLRSWNRCSFCNYISLDSIWGDEVKPDTCPQCGSSMIEAVKPTERPKVIREYCTAAYCIKNRYFDRNELDCKYCGFNNKEKQRRINLPWSRKGWVRYKNIHLNLEDVL